MPCIAVDAIVSLAPTRAFKLSLGAFPQSNAIYEGTLLRHCSVLEGTTMSLFSSRQTFTSTSFLRRLRYNIISTNFCLFVCITISQPTSSFPHTYPDSSTAVSPPFTRFSLPTGIT